MHNTRRFQTSNHGILKVCESSTKAGGFPFKLIFALLLAVPLLAGCLSKKPLKVETFVITGQSLANISRTNGPVLAVQRVSVAPTFDTTSLTYRIGDVAFERDPYAGLLVSPSENFSEPIRVYLQNSGLFHVVIGWDSTLRPDLELETHITQLVGDFRDRTRPIAVLELQFVLIEVSGRKGGNIIFQKSYLRRIPMKTRTAAAVVAGWNEGLREIMQEFTGDLRMNVQRGEVTLWDRIER